MLRSIAGCAIALVASVGLSVAAPSMAAAATQDGSALQTLINQDRASAGLPPLAWSPCLASVAQQNAQRIANQGFLSHTDGPTVDMGCGVQSTGGGENIAYISSGVNDPQVNTMYMNSPGHRANILGAYNFVGTAWVVAPNGSGYNAEEFLAAPALQPTDGGLSAAGWDSLGGAVTSGPDASSWGASRLDVFIRGTDNGLWRRSFDGTSWSSWEGLGGVLTADPSAISWGTNRIDVFVRGTTGELWHRTFDGSTWSAWDNLGGMLTSAPGTASWGAGRLDVFVRGTDKHLWHRAFNGTGWGAWESLGGVLTSVFVPVFVEWLETRGREESWEVARSVLSIATSGELHGHPGAAAAFGVAATPASGPFPQPFSASNAVETFSSDGPRRVFYQANGTPYTPGNVSSTGGVLRQKPDITAADGVSGQVLKVQGGVVQVVQGWRPASTLTSDAPWTIESIAKGRDQLFALGF